MSYPQNNVVYPSMLMNSPASFMGQKKAIKLAGRLLSIRHYTVKSGSPRTQILIGDSPESYMQLLQFRRESTALIPSSMIGKHIVFEPVILSQSNKMFDSSPCPLTAILSDRGSYRFTEQHIDPKIAPAGLFSFDKFLPVLTTLDKIRPDTCVNVFGKIETIIDRGTGDDSMKFKVIDGSIGIIASTLVVIPKGGRGGKGSDSFTDVYSIDGHALDRAKEGDYILMLDMMSGISLEDGQLTQTLRAWGPTRIKIDILNETLKSNLERRFSTNDDKEYCSGAKYAESRLPSCKIFDGTTKKSSRLSSSSSSSSTVIVYGVLTSFVSSFPYTRTRRVWTQGTDNTNEGVDWEDGKYGRLQDPSDPSNQLDETVFDLQALFHECQTVFRYSNKAAARLLNVSSVDEFASMEENEKESRLLDVMYRAMVFKAWRTSSGDIMILDVIVFPGVVTDVSNINNDERKDGEAVVSDGQVHHPVEKKKCCENEQSSLAMFDI